MPIEEGAYRYLKLKNGAIIATDVGMWHVSVEGDKTKLSQDMTIEEFERLKNRNEFADSIIWNEHLKINPNETVIAYASNKNGILKGYSLWRMDLKTGEEVLWFDTTGAYNIPEGWLNDDTLLFSQHMNGNKKFYLINISNNKVQEISLEGADPKILLTENGKIVYFPNYSQGNVLKIVTCTENVQVTTKQALLLDSYVDSDKMFVVNDLQTIELQKNSVIYDDVHLNPGNTKLGYVYSETGADARKIGVVDLNNQKIREINSPLAIDNRKIISYKWLDDESLSVKMKNVSQKETTFETWKYEF